LQQEVELPSDNLGIDVGTTGGSWLFKQGDLLLGPVQFTKIVELLYAGDLDDTTPVAPFNLEPKFIPLGQVERFRVHLAKSKAKLRVEAASQTMNRERRRGRLVKLSATGLLSIGLLIGGGLLAWWLAIHRPWERQIQMPEGVIEDEMPQIKLASARSGDELAYPDARDTPSHPRPRQPRNPVNPANPANPSHPGTNPATNLPKPGTNPDDVAVVQQWDQEAINGVVRASKATLHPCLAAETRREKPGWEARIPIEFTIGNDGHVSKLWIDNPDFKGEGSELFKCMYAELRKWKFPNYQGEQANVSLAFRIQSK
jgi:hypothetical protein